MILAFCNREIGDLRAGAGLLEAFALEADSCRKSTKSVEKSMLFAKNLIISWQNLKQSVILV